MARTRSLKPGFFTNDVLAEVEPLGRLLFQGLWCHADREGRLHDRPKKIKVEILPYDDCNVDRLLEELSKRNFITRYEIDGNFYIQINNFSKHQNPHVKEVPSTIPAPDKNHTSRALTLNPITLTLNPKHGASKPDALVGFDKFWLAYPKKKSKGQAEKAWKKLNPNEQLQDRIHLALERAKTSADWKKDNGQFIPYPASWLNAKGWEDEDGPRSEIKNPFAGAV